MSGSCSVRGGRRSAGCSSALLADEPPEVLDRHVLATGEGGDHAGRPRPGLFRGFLSNNAALVGVALGVGTASRS